MTTMQAVRDDEPLTLDGLRGAIDELDRTVIAALTVRAQLSNRVQLARQLGGGARVDLRREAEIFDAYRRGLGRGDGLAMAEAVLRLCRGSLSIG